MASVTPPARPLPGRTGQWLGRMVRLRSGDSPTKLQAATALTVILAILLSVGGWYSVDGRAAAIEDAAAAAEQLIRVQDVRVLVVQADSIASNAYLVQGQESREQRAQYDDRIATASTRLVEASSAAATSDIGTLEQVATRLATYVGLVEQARSNNRQGFPVGAAYQRQAKAVADDVVVLLREVEQSSPRRVNDSMDRAHSAGWLLVLAALLLLAALVGGSLWLAARWRRLINVPIAIAGLLVLLVLTVGGGVNHRAVSRADDIVRGPLSSADLLAQARAAGFDARSNEALTLIARGNGQAYERQWQLSTSVVDTALASACERFDRGCEGAARYRDYTGVHERVRNADNSGDWEGAVETVTGPATLFDAFVAGADADLRADASAATLGFDDAVSSLGTLRVMVVLAGLLTAGLAVGGYAQRVREYR